jgi:hypothetical protein
MISRQESLNNNPNIHSNHDTVEEDLEGIK